MADNFKFVQGINYKLAGSGCIATATEIILSSFKLPDGTLITMDMFGDTGYFTQEPGTSKEENGIFTGVTQNANGTATLTGVVKGLKFVAPYTSDSALKLAHAGGTILIISNSAPFYNELSAKDNDEIITSQYTFTDPKIPKMDVYSAPTDDTQFATKKYVDEIASGGTVSINRIVVAGTAGEVVSAGKVVYFDTTDKEWKLADGSSVATCDNVLLGIAQGAGTNGVGISGGVLLEGLDSNQTGFTAGDTLYISDTAGTIASSAGTISKKVGYAKSATEIYFKVDTNDLLKDNGGIDRDADGLFIKLEDTDPSLEINVDGELGVKHDSTLVVGASGLGVNVSGLNNITVIAGENIDVTSGPVPVFYDYDIVGVKQIENTTGNSDQGNRGLQYGQTFTTTSTATYIEKVNLYISRHANFTSYGVEVFIYETSAGLPTGSPIGRAYIPYTSIATSYGLVEFKFNNPVKVSPSTMYAMVMCSQNGSYDITWRYNNSSVYAGGTLVSTSNDGSSWSKDDAKDFVFNVYEMSSTKKAFKSDANDYYRYKFDGFAITTATAGNNINVQTAGIVSGFTGLSTMDTYFVQDTIGTISNSKGTYEIKTGKAVSDSQLLIEKGNSEYIGSTSIDYSNIIALNNNGYVASVPFDAKYFICHLYGYTSGTNYIGQIFPIYRNGISSGGIFDKGDATGYQAISVSLNKGAIFLATLFSGSSANTNITGTIYFYR